MKATGVYADYCVAFIDILGFKEMTKDYVTIKRNARIINNAINAMKTYRPKQSGLFEKSDINILQMSDSLVFIFPKDFASIFTSFQWIEILQFLLARTGIYLRGSINSGSMYIDEMQDRYFGEAWNKAVIAEGNAINPRILIEPCLAKFVERRLREINEGVLEFYLDDDASYVLSSYNSITAGIATTFKEADTAYSEMLDRLLLSVEQVKDNKLILRKYLWIIRQTNCPQCTASAAFANKAERIKEQLIDYLTQE